VPVELRRPSSVDLRAYVEALERGWSADNIRGKLAADEELAAIAHDPADYLDRQYDPEARGGAIKMLDGTTMPRLPGYRLWIFGEGEFCGSLGFRWRPGTAELPPYCLGHVGYAVPPWKEGRGYATAALGLFLPMARESGLPHIDLTTDPDNIPSQKVILKNGGVLVEKFQKPEVYGGGDGLRFRITL